MSSGILPFPRGQTFGDGEVTMSATVAQHLIGQCFDTFDTVHDTGVNVKLRVVQNDSGGTITMARKCVCYSTSAEDFGRKVLSFSSTSAGGIAKPIDDAMTVGASILSHDLFYVVEEGPCYVLNSSTSVSIAQHAHVTVAAGGTLGAAAAAATSVVLGVLDQAQTTGDGGDSALVWVGKPFIKG